MKYLTAIIPLLFLASCMTPVQRPWVPVEATATDAATHSVSYHGRFAVRYDSVEGHMRKMRGAYGHFKWRENSDSDTVRLQLFDPLGQTLAIIVSSPLGAALELPHRPRQTAANVEDLMQNTLGFALPISSLQHWLHSSLTSLKAEAATDTNFNRPIQTKQDGWTIEALTPPIAIASASASTTRIQRINLSHDDPPIEVKLVIEP